MRTGYRNGIVPRPAIERLRARLVVDTVTGCHIFTGKAGPSGYGTIRLGGQGSPSIGVHRLAYLAANGPIPKGLHLDHLCRNPLCCNPGHLEAVTQRENTLRGLGPTANNARKTYCPAGHEYTPENTYQPPRGGRQCKICRRAASVERARQKRKSPATDAPQPPTQDDAGGGG